MRTNLFLYLAVSFLIDLPHILAADRAGNLDEQKFPRPQLRYLEFDAWSGKLLGALVQDGASTKRWSFSGAEFVPRGLTWKEENSPRGFAFERLPSVTTVPRDDSTGVPDPRVTGTVHRFRDAAFFPLHDWGCDPDLSADQVLLIYEGMEIEFSNDGQYDVRFTAGAPAMPVDVRLQLHAWNLTANGNPPNRRLGTITLPLIRIPPEDSREEVPQREYFITHSGFSADLAEHYSREFTFTRVGTARFGFGDPTR